jgi:hypothetical protein
LSSSPPDTESMDFDKTPSNEADSNNGSDEDDFTKKNQRSSVDDDNDFDNDDLDETDLRNIWRKRRKLSDHHQQSSTMQTEKTKHEQNNPNNNQTKVTNEYKNVDKHPGTNCLYVRPHDHQVPTVLPVHQDDIMVMSNRLV